MQVAFLLYDRFTILDVTGPYEVLNRLPDAETVFVAEQSGPIRSEPGSLSLPAERTIDDVSDPEILVVPRGPRKPGAS
jgi:putative intracellular protease/amidase